MSCNDTLYLPYSCGEVTNTLYDEETPVALSLAVLWNKWAPVGKGAIPRLLGRFFGSTLRYSYISSKYGAYLVIEPTSLDVYAHMINHGKTWNEHVFDACKTFLKKGSVFYDIGANIGYMSIEMAKAFNDKVQVISFEPQPLLAHSIALSSKLNKFNNLRVFDLMLGESLGKANLYIGSHSIHASAIAREKHSLCISRPVATIDYMVETGCIPPPNVIKLDIEGGELAALAGAKKTICTNRPYIIFESDENMNRFGYSRKNIIDQIKTMGLYDFYFIHSTNCRLVKFNEENSSSCYTDILAIPL